MSQPDAQDEADIDQHGAYFVVMDNFGGDWTPSAILPDAEEAIKLRQMLSKDADAVVDTAPYYETKQNVRDRTPSLATEGLEELSVTFAGKDVLAIAENDLAAREMQIEKGGLRGTEEVFETAEDVATERPSVVGEFILSEMSSEDILEAIR